MGKLIDAAAVFEREPSNQGTCLVGPDYFINSRVLRVKDMSPDDLRILVGRLRGEVPQNIVTTDFSQPR